MQTSIVAATAGGTRRRTTRRSYAIANVAAQSPTGNRKNRPRAPSSIVAAAKTTAKSSGASSRGQALRPVRRPRTNATMLAPSATAQRSTNTGPYQLQKGEAVTGGSSARSPSLSLAPTARRLCANARTASQRPPSTSHGSEATTAAAASTAHHAVRRARRRVSAAASTTTTSAAAAIGRSATSAPAKPDRSKSPRA